MKAWVASDMHIDVLQDQRSRDNREPLEFWPPPEADIAIIPGDIMEGAGAIEWADQLGIPTLVVPGNHEYYRHNIDSLEMELRRRAAESQNVTLLHNDRHDIGNTRFLGTTLWTDYALDGNPSQSMSNASACMADHRVITTGFGPARRFFHPETAQQVHFRCREWLVRELSEPHDGPTVVITHHLPHMRSIHPMYIGTSPINASFASDLGDIIRAHDIDIWIHGHTHWTFDYVVDSTRIVCNPYGYYPSSEIRDFDPNFLVDI